MNDFTKEELHLLVCWSADRALQVGSEQAQEEGTIDLSRKIQNMIFNYCEHDCKSTIWQCQVTSCSKCGYPSTLIKADR